MDTENKLGKVWGKGREQTGWWGGVGMCGAKNSGAGERGVEGGGGGYIEGSPVPTAFLPYVIASRFKVQERS